MKVSAIIANIKKRKGLVYIIGAVVAVSVGAIFVVLVLPGVQKITMNESSKTPKAVNLRTGSDIEKEINNTTNQSKKAELYKELSVTQQIDGDNKKAKTSIEKSIEFNKNADSYVRLAYLFEKEGDEDKAIRYYQEALKLLKPSNGNVRGDYEEVQWKINQLMGER